MFKKNLDVLQKKNKSLAEKLAAINLEEVKEDIEVYQAESGDLIFTYQGLALDDIYDPMRVAKTNWNLNVTKTPVKYDIVVVFGLGLGYLFKRAYVNSTCRILLYEPEIRILRYVLEYVDFSKEFADDRVFVTTDKNEALKFLTEKYLSDDTLYFIYPEAYAQLCTETMSTFTNDIVEVCNLKKMDINTIKKMAKNWAKHALSNLTNMQTSRPFSWLKDSCHGKTALIAAAGPSLADNMELIKENRNKFIIFSVNRAAPNLIKNGIKPDFVLFADVNPVKHDLEEVIEELKSVNIISDLRANSFVYSTFENVLTYFSKNDLIAQNINNYTGNQFSLLETAGTATAQAYYAARMLGITNIIFAGLDLAFKDDLIYSDGKTINHLEDNRISVNNTTKSLVTVKDLNGNPIQTRDDYAMFIRQFEDIFEVDTNSTVYNLSDFGAYIKGMTYTKLNDLLPSLATQNDDFTSYINNFKAETFDKWSEIYSKITELLKEEKINLKNISDKTSLLLSKEKDIIEKVANTDANKEINVELANLSSEFSALLPEIIQDSFLSQYFQSEFVTFVNMNNNCENEALETFIKLKNFEVQLLESIVSISTCWIDFLEKKFD